MRVHMCSRMCVCVCVCVSKTLIQPGCTYENKDEATRASDKVIVNADLNDVLFLDRLCTQWQSQDSSKGH